jgi:predicted nucleic acid-binding protein
MATQRYWRITTRFLGKCELLNSVRSSYEVIHWLVCQGKQGATELRARTLLKTPDALQAASALSLSQACKFLTADAGFGRVAQLDVRHISVTIP